MHSSLIFLASQKLGYAGEALVIDNDGSLIDEDEILPLIKNETLVLVGIGQNWQHKSNAAFMTTYNTTENVQIITKESPVYDENKLNETQAVFQYILTDPNQPSTSVQCPQTYYVAEKPHEIETNLAQIQNVQPQRTELKGCNQEVSWKNFQIPWNKVPDYIIKQFADGLKNKQSITRLIHIVVGDMRSIKTLIPVKAFKLAAYKIIDKYRIIFEDVDEDGVTLGDGSGSLTARLQERNNYLNRPCKRPSKIGEENPVKNKKSNVSARAGCVNWNPSSSVTLNTAEDKFSAQRSFINSNRDATLLQLKEKWDDFAKYSSIIDHFKRLTKSDVNLIDKAITERYDKIHAFAKSDGNLKKKL